MQANTNTLATPTVTLTETVEVPVELLRDLLRTIEANNDSVERDNPNAFPYTRSIRIAQRELAAFLPTVKPQLSLVPAKEREIIGGADRCFYKAARNHGLNTCNSDAMKEAMRDFLDCQFESRADLSDWQWRKCRAAVEAGLLKWA